MAVVMKGSPVAQEINRWSIERTQELLNRSIVPTLAIVRVGEKTEEIAYERNAMKRAEKCGVQVKNYILPEDAVDEDVAEIIHEINVNDQIHGCLMLRPLPAHMDEQRLRNLLAVEKDVDCITDLALSQVYTGQKTGFAPCTPEACMAILAHYGYNPGGKRAVVIGRSQVIGMPSAMLLLGADATVTICHSKTENLQELVKDADFVVAAAGKAGMVDGSCMAPGQVILDVGINEGADGKLVGDVNFEQAETIVEAITPVPGGVGAVTTSLLIRHTVEACLNSTRE